MISEKVEIENYNIHFRETPRNVNFSLGTAIRPRLGTAVEDRWLTEDRWLNEDVRAGKQTDAAR